MRTACLKESNNTNLRMYPYYFQDYDYSYDYDQLTSKPILSLLGSLSGNKPSSTTNAPNITAGSTSTTTESVNTASLNSTNDGN